MQVISEMLIHSLSTYFSKFTIWFIPVAQMVKNACNAGDGFSFRVRKVSWRRDWQPIPVLLTGESLDRGAWLATVHGVAKSQTPLSD